MGQAPTLPNLYKLFVAKKETYIFIKSILLFYIHIEIIAHTPVLRRRRRDILVYVLQ